MSYHLQTACPLSTVMKVACATAIVCVSLPSYAQVACVQANTKVVRGKVITSLSTATRFSSCKSGEVKAMTGPVGPAGATGATGPAGADGQLRVYGNGSAGAGQFTTTDAFVTNPLNMYTDVTIASGTTLFVASGAEIRCTGSFINNGTIRVEAIAEHGSMRFSGSRPVAPSYHPPHPGVSSRVPASGEVGDESTLCLGGDGGLGVSFGEAFSFIRPGAYGGGGGAGALGINGSGVGGRGGGTLVVLCNGPVINNGSIIADGEDPAMPVGGGGGGIVVLASRSSVTLGSSSTISVEGGRGGNGTSNTGPSGGGGGGIVHLLAPVVTAAKENVSVLGGDPGTAGTTTDTVRTGGHGGGACGGNGGAGGRLGSFSTILSPPEAGSKGHFLSSTLDPTSLF